MDTYRHTVSRSHSLSLSHSLTLSLSFSHSLTLSHALSLSHSLTLSLSHSLILSLSHSLTHSCAARRDAQHNRVRSESVHACAQPCPKEVRGGTGRVGRSLAPRSFVGRPRRYGAIDGAFPYVGSLMIFVLQSEVAYGTRLAVLAGYGYT